MLLLQLLERILQLFGGHLVERVGLAIRIAALFRILRHLLTEELVILALQRVAALHPVALRLVELEGLVHELLLILQQFAELLDLLTHGIVLLAHLLLAAAGLQIVHHPLQFRQQLACLIARAGARQVLDLVHHPFEVLLAQDVVRVHLARHTRVLRRLLGEGLHVFLHGLAQLLHQLGDFLVGRIALQRVRERLLCVAQAPLGERQVAIFDAERDLP
ncbi:hypothetical protein D9M70_467190 [compost metagenome]